MRMMEKAQREKHKDRFATIQTYNSQAQKEMTKEAMSKYREDCQAIENRKKIRLDREKEASNRNRETWIRTQKADGFGFGGDSGSFKDIGAKSAKSGDFKAANKGLFGDYVDRLEAEEKLKRCEDKITKGKENLRNQLE